MLPRKCAKHKNTQKKQWLGMGVEIDLWLRLNPRSLITLRTDQDKINFDWIKGATVRVTLDYLCTLCLKTLCDNITYAPWGQKAHLSCSIWHCQTLATWNLYDMYQIICWMNSYKLPFTSQKWKRTGELHTCFHK